MNPQLQDFARTKLKTDLATLPESNQRIFKLMYGRDDGRRSVADAEAMPIGDVVDAMPEDRLDWAMTQVANSLAKVAAKHSGE